MRYKKFNIIALLLFVFGLIGLQGQTTGTISDSRDNKVYKTVKIGEQVWMAENLAYKPTSGNYWAYDNNPTNIDIYGYLYSWETARKACPTGWHISTDEEWQTLTQHLGGDSTAGHKLKDNDTTYWICLNLDRTNETGFTALPGGYRYRDGPFTNIGDNGYWWSATEFDASEVWYHDMSCDFSAVGKGSLDKKVGLSVRCVKD